MTDIWQVSQYDREAVEILERRLGVSHPIAVLLVLRGLVDPSEADSFLRADLDDLSDPFLMAGMREAVARIGRAVQRQEKVVVYGDYDVDGICSIVILTECLRRLGGLADHYVPDRMTEGYGMNDEAVRQLAQQGCRLLITVDCGISSVDEVDTAIQLGMDVIITDHHHPPAVLPAALAIINPKIGCPPATAELAGAGVAWKLASALVKGGDVKELLQEWLVLAALATVADMVPLQNENRIIVKSGLGFMPATRRIGLRQLIEESGLGGRPIQAWHLGFVLGPRLNAAGRMDSAQAAIELLMGRDEPWAQKQARWLNQLNEERRQVEEGILEAALAIIEAHPAMKSQSVLVVAEDNWNVGVLGIVASRLTAVYNRPSIVLSWDGDTGRGSARSPEGFDLYAALDSVSDELLSFGGHMMAAGLSVRRDRLEPMRQGLLDYAARMEYRWEIRKRYPADLEIEEEDINTRFLEELKRLGPFGQGNPVPAFIMRGRTIRKASRVGSNGSHVLMEIGSGGWNGIAFNGAENMEEVFPYFSQDLLFGLDENHYKGKKTIQLKVKTVKPSFQPDDGPSGGVSQPGLFRVLTRAAGELALRRPIMIVYPTYRSLVKQQAVMDYYFCRGKVLTIHGHLAGEERRQRQELLGRGLPAVFLMTDSSFKLFREQFVWPVQCRYAVRMWSDEMRALDSWPEQVEIEEIWSRRDYLLNRCPGSQISGDRVLIYANLPSTIKKLRSTWPNIRIESGLPDMGQRLKTRRSYWCDPQGPLVTDGTWMAVRPRTGSFAHLVLMDSPLGWYELPALTEGWGDAAEQRVGVAFGPASPMLNWRFLDQLYPSLDTISRVWTHLLASARPGPHRVEEIAVRLEQEFNLSRLETDSVLHILADLNLCHFQKRSSIMAINRGTSGNAIESLEGSPYWSEGIAERAVLSGWEERLISSLEW